MLMAPTSLFQVVQQFKGALMTDQMRQDLQSAADNYLREKITRSTGVALEGELVSVLISASDELAVFLKHRGAVAPLRRAGFILTPFKLRSGKAIPATSSTADGWRVEVTGGLESSTGVSEWLTAVLFRDSVEVEASVPMPAPARGRGFYGAVLEQAYGVAAQLLQEAHRFLLGADLTESAGAP